MPITRSRTDIVAAYTGKLVKIGSDDVGYLVEGSLKVKGTPQTVVDEDGATHQAGVLVEYEFELLQGGAHNIALLETYVGSLQNIYIADGTLVLYQVPINIELEHQYEIGKPLTIKVKGAKKAMKLSDVYQET